MSTKNIDLSGADRTIFNQTLMIKQSLIALFHANAKTLHNGTKRKQISNLTVISY